MTEPEFLVEALLVKNKLIPFVVPTDYPCMTSYARWAPVRQYYKAAMKIEKTIWEEDGLPATQAQEDAAVSKFAYTRNPEEEM